MNLDNLNEVQKRAVTTVDGPVLVLAGAGSGKTSVLTHRVAYLIEEMNIRPYNILALTFTNKAAGEMKERIEKLVEVDMKNIVISTFHSMCAKFLRYDAGFLGYENNFTIYDSSDTLSIVKKIIKDNELRYANIKPNYARGIISTIKNTSTGESAEAIAKDMAGTDLGTYLVEIFNEYNNRLIKENAMDFDDLLINMLRLLKENDEIRDYFQNRFRYVLVDEFQDTNLIQYEIVKIISQKHRNLFVVGDDDQSIYGWRGADIRNILNFEKDFTGTKVIKLEQNYRSHQMILDCANAVISHNMNRKDKNPWSANTKGEVPKLYSCGNEYTEADYIARKITEYARKGINYGDMAVLYRMNTQSRVLEEKLRTYGIPYFVFGGISFYARKEIKDIVAYLTVLSNSDSDTSLARIINVPKRGIGNTTVEKIISFAEDRGISMFEACRYADQYLGSAASKVSAFVSLIDSLKEKIADIESVKDILEVVCTDTLYMAMLQMDDSADSLSQIENIQELISSAHIYDNQAEEPTLDEFLSSISLITDMDTVDDKGGVTLMTLHGSKGLEYEVVFIAGMEENIFPSKRAVDEGRIEEERRLLYVGITRAKNILYLTHSKSRNMYGSGPVSEIPSRFLAEIPETMVEDVSEVIKRNVSFLDDTDFKTAPRNTGTSSFYKPKAEFVSKAKAPADSFKVGDKVKNIKYGTGTIIDISGEGDKKVARISFVGGERKFFLAYAPLEKV